MNPREKLLAAVTAGLLVAGALWLAVRWGVVARWEALNQKIARERARIVKLQTALKDARGAEQRWKDLKPLSNNPHRAEQRFRQDLSEMLEQHGLRDDFTVRTLPRRRLRSDFTEIRLAVQARGTLQQLVNFLCDFYRRGYVARIDQINVTADDVLARSGSSATWRSRTGRRAAPGAVQTQTLTIPTIGPEGPQLAISFSASALVLPLIGGIESQPHPDPLAPPPQERGRLPRTPEEYSAIWQKNFFRPYQEPPRVATTQPATAPLRVVDTSTPAPPPPPPRPRKSVVAVSARSGRLEVGVRDLDRREQPLEWYGINDPIDDGTLVLVNHGGIVVAVEENHGGRREYVYYFYKLGSSFEERQRLDPGQHPEIQAQLEQVLES